MQINDRFDASATAKQFFHQNGSDPRRAEVFISNSGTLKIWKSFNKHEDVVSFAIEYAE